MRIAVHPALLRRGLGARLVTRIHRDAVAQGVDYVGASFGATDALLAFWHNVKWWPVRVGFGRDHASGSHSVMVLRPLTPAGETLYAAARARFVTYLPHWLSDPLRDLEAELAATLFRREDGSLEAVQLAAAEWEQLRHFAHGRRDYAESMAALWQLGCAALGNPLLKLGDTEREVLVTKVLQKRPWPEVIAVAGLAGRAEAVAVLRSAARELLDYSSSNAARERN